MPPELLLPVSQSRKVSRAEHDRLGLYAYLYHELRELVDEQGNQLREISPIESTRWLIAAHLGSADKQLAIFLRSLMFHLGAWAKMRVAQARLTKGWQLRNVQELFEYTPAGMDFLPSVFMGDRFLYDKRDFYITCDRADREKLKTFCMSGDSRSVKTTLGFDPMNTYVSKLVYVIIHMELYYQSGLHIKRQKDESHTAWFNHICDALMGRNERTSRDRPSTLPRKGQRK